MIRSQYLSTFALAALLGAAPAFAGADAKDAAASTPGTSTTTTTATPGAAYTVTTVNGITMINGRPLCGSPGHPNAGNLADKDTGAAKENSASPVHTDCVTEAEVTALTSSTWSGTTSSISPSENAAPGTSSPNTGSAVSGASSSTSGAASGK